jgi:hypothetical protein
MTTGVVILLFAVYELYGTGLTTAREQDRLERQLAVEWADPPAVERSAPPVRPVQPPELGSPVAVLTIPRLGEDYRHVVVEGVGREELKKGPGHQPGTAWPGQLGNVVLAGHRTTYGPPSGVSTNWPLVTRLSSPMRMRPTPTASRAPMSLIRLTPRSFSRCHDSRGLSRRSGWSP